MAQELTALQSAELAGALERAKGALDIIATYDQARVDRLCQAVAWAVANKRTCLLYTSPSPRDA